MSNENRARKAIVRTIDCSLPEAEAVWGTLRALPADPVRRCTLQMTRVESHGQNGGVSSGTVARMMAHIVGYASGERDEGITSLSDTIAAYPAPSSRKALCREDIQVEMRRLFGKTVLREFGEQRSASRPEYQSGCKFSVLDADQEALEFCRAFVTTDIGWRPCYNYLKRRVTVPPLWGVRAQSEVARIEIWRRSLLHELAHAVAPRTLISIYSGVPLSLLSVSMMAGAYYTNSLHGRGSVLYFAGAFCLMATWYYRVAAYALEELTAEMCGSYVMVEKGWALAVSEASFDYLRSYSGNFANHFLRSRAFERALSEASKRAVIILQGTSTKASRTKSL